MQTHYFPKPLFLYGLGAVPQVKQCSIWISLKLSILAVAEHCNGLYYESEATFLNKGVLFNTYC
jgi:hypothetical protein